MPARKRKRSPAAVRLLLGARQNGRCPICGNVLQPRHIHVDHIVPLSLGGTNRLSNLQATCDACNLRKGAKVA